MGEPAGVVTIVADGTVRREGGEPEVHHAEASFPLAIEGRTALLISHRVAALELADVVIVLEDGQVVEKGPPKELLERDGPYRRLHRRQRAEEELESF